MTTVWIEGFESHLVAQQMARKYATFSGSWSSQAGRVFGTAGGPISTVAVTPSFGTDNSITMGFGLRFNAHSTLVNSDAQGLYVELGMDEQCHVELESDVSLGFRFGIYRGSTLIVNSSFFDFGVWHYFEIELTVRTGTNGSYEIRHNGVLDVSAGSVDLADTGGDGWDVFAWRYSSNLGTILRYDDCYVNNGAGSTNTSFLGPSVVEGLLPNANGATIQWTNNGTGDNFTSVDDLGTSNPDDTGAGGTNGSDTNAQIDLYAMEDLQQITGTVHAVQVGIQLGMAAAGTRTVRGKYRDPDTTVVNLDSHVVDNPTFDEFTQVLDQNPNSAAAWDIADIDDGQFGVEVVS